MTSGAIYQQIEARLQQAFDPEILILKDVSAAHAGHAGARPGGESHFELTIKAARFEGLARLAAHRLINAELADLLAGPVHALQITLHR
jgi:BolA protein